MRLQQLIAADLRAALVDPERTARARALARLLFHAMLDAEDLDCDAAAEKVRDGIELVKKKFALTEDGMLAPLGRALSFEVDSVPTDRGPVSLDH